MKIAQHILMISLKYELDMAEVSKYKLPAEPRNILIRNEANYLPKERLRYSKSVIEKSLHVIRYRRSEAQNSIREASEFMNKNIGEAYIKNMLRVMKHVAGMPESVLFIKPKEKLGGELDYEFILKDVHITGMQLIRMKGKEFVAMLRNCVEWQWQSKVDREKK